MNAIENARVRYAYAGQHYRRPRPSRRTLGGIVLLALAAATLLALAGCKQIGSAAIRSAPPAASAASGAQR